jgi:hypothetical protein
MIEKIIPILMLCTFLLLAACTPQTVKTQTNSDLVLTQAVQTVGAMLTSTVNAEPTQTPTAADQSVKLSFTASPSASALPTQPVQLAMVSSNSSSSYVTSACDSAALVSDGTIPDGTDIIGGTSFTKSWLLKNAGTCTWNSSYLLVFYSGSSMGGPVTQQLTTGTVAPGATIQVSVTLTAPSSTGAYTGYWVLRNASGSNFGIGTGNSPFYVLIIVSSVVTSTPTPTATDEVTATPTPTVTLQPATSAPQPTSTTAPTSSTAPTTTTAPTSTTVPTETPAPTAASAS